jgi:acetolactate synthase-1/3 small subunit
MSRHMISVHVEDKPGALARISMMFARRGFNIESLAVGPSERPGVSRLSLCVNCSHTTIEQVTKQIHKLVNVLRVTELDADESVERELMLIKVTANVAKRAELVAIAGAAGAAVIDIGTDSIAFELVGLAADLDAFEVAVEPYGVKELVRTGRIGMSRSSAKATLRRQRSVS